MRKLLPLLTLLFTCICSLLAQDTTLFNYDYYHFSYNSKTREMSITGTDREVDAHYYISMGTIPKKYTPVRIVIGNDSLTVVYFHKHKKNCSLYTQSFSKMDLHPAWNVNLALSINSKRGYYYHVVTPDGSKCALAFWYHDKNLDSYKLKTAVINGDGKKLYKYEYIDGSRFRTDIMAYGLKEDAFYFVPDMHSIYLLDASGLHYYSGLSNYQYINPYNIKTLILSNSDYLATGCNMQTKAIGHFDFQKKQFIYTSESFSEQELLKSSFSMMHRRDSPKQEDQKITIIGFYELPDHSYISVYQATGRSYKEETVTSTWKDKDGKTRTTTSTQKVNYINYWGDILIEQISSDFKFTNNYVIKSYMWAKWGKHLATATLEDGDLVLTYGLKNDVSIIRKNAEGGLDIIKVDPDAELKPADESEKFNSGDESPEFDDDDE